MNVGDGFDDGFGGGGGGGFGGGLLKYSYILAPIHVAAVVANEYKNSIMQIREPIYSEIEKKSYNNIVVIIFSCPMKKNIAFGIWSTTLLFFLFLMVT